MSRPLKSAPSQKNTSFFSVSGSANGAIGLLGSISGRNGAVTAMNSQKNTSDTPITATVDSRQVVIAIDVEQDGRRDRRQQDEVARRAERMAEHDVERERHPHQQDQQEHPARRGQARHQGAGRAVPSRSLR